MKGIFKNDFYMVYANAKAFSIFMFLFGIFAVVCAGTSSGTDSGLYYLMYYVLIGIVGFSVNTVVAVFNGESTSKWGKYKITLPVKRADIVKSLFLSHIFWLGVGIVFAGAGTGLAGLLYGYSFAQYRELSLIFALGISISLLVGAIFIPLFYLGGEDKTIAFLIISLLCAIGIASLFVNVTTNVDYLLRLAVILGSSAVALLLSCPLTLCIFRRKEY